jgi:hypothetical protein
LAVLVAYWALLAWCWRRLWVWEGDRDDSKFMLGAFLVMATGIGIISLSTLPTALSGFVNPEYWALKQLLP